MPTYNTPGVYIEETPVLPPAVHPVATAIPVFIGYTEKAVDAQGNPLTKVATRITSLKEYETRFGLAPVQAVRIRVDQRLVANPGIDVRWAAASPQPTDLLYYALQSYFANGGGPCWIYSLGGYGMVPQPDHFTEAIRVLETQDEPTLLVFPDATRMPDADYGAVVTAALASSERLRSRFTIADVPRAQAGSTSTNAQVTENFRGRIGGTTRQLGYGAAYFPYVQTNQPFRFDDAAVSLAGFTQDKTPIPVPGIAPSDSHTPRQSALPTLGMSSIRKDAPAVYQAIQTFLGTARVVLPPSAGVAGVCAQIDRTRGVWKAPANVSMALALRPMVDITDALQDALNVDVDTGKSVNCIRLFPGKGTMVWGARTLAGNDNEWRYVNVRRFANFLEESIGKAMQAFISEPNTAGTWGRVRAMIEHFLMRQWRDGALMGTKPEQAFHVAVGLGRTMSAQDILEGRLIVEVHFAVIRPAEFIVLRLVQPMPPS